MAKRDFGKVESRVQVPDVAPFGVVVQWADNALAVRE
jgi:hypothetical protein